MSCIEQVLEATPNKDHGLLPSITKTIQIRWTEHAGHFWRSKDEHISDVLLWTPSHGRAKVGRPARTYIQQLCADTGCGLEDLPGAMDDRDGWRKRIRDIRARSVTWWWWIFQESWKKLRNIKVAVISIVVRVRGTVNKCLEKILEELEIIRRVDTILTMALLRSATILRRDLGIRGDLLSLRFQSNTTN